MGLLDKIKKVFKGKDKKNNKPSYNPEQMKWAQVAYEQALKRKEPFINHEAAGSGELNEKILLMLAKANKFDIEDAAGDDNLGDESPLTAEEQKEWAAMKRRFSPSNAGEVLGYEETMSYYIYNWKEKHVYELEYYFGPRKTMEMLSKQGVTVESFIKSCKEAYRFISTKDDK